MRLLVIGGSDAGITAALRARELDPAVEVTVVVADAFPDFSICGLPYYLSGDVPDWRDLAHRTTADLEQAGIQLLLDHTARAIDPAAKQVTVTSQRSGERQLGYDQLVIGTGAVPVRPPIDGLDLPGVQVLHTMGDTFALHQALTAGARSAVIVGGGYIGLEMAEAFTARGLDVTVVEQAPAVMPTVDVELGRLLGEELRRHDVQVVNDVTVKAIHHDAAGLTVAGEPDFATTADLVLVVVGVRPDTQLAVAAGVQTGVRGALRVDRHMRTNLPDVLAAGDCVETWHRLLEAPTYLPLGTTAHKQGRIAGDTAVGGDRTFAGSLGTQVVKVFELAVARTGLRDPDARQAGFDPVTVGSVQFDHKAYYPGGHQLHLRITGGRRSGRLLGAQLVGHHDAEVAKRIDIPADALFHHMSVDGLNELDLSYTPPFGSPWDAVQLAAQDWVRQTRALPAPCCSLIWPKTGSMLCWPARTGPCHHWGGRTVPAPPWTVTIWRRPRGWHGQWRPPRGCRTRGPPGRHGRPGCRRRGPPPPCGQERRPRRGGGPGDQHLARLEAVEVTGPCEGCCEVPVQHSHAWLCASKRR